MISMIYKELLHVHHSTRDTAVNCPAAADVPMSQCLKMVFLLWLILISLKWLSVLPKAASDVGLQKSQSGWCRQKSQALTWLTGGRISYPTSASETKSLIDKHSHSNPTVQPKLLCHDSSNVASMCTTHIHTHTRNAQTLRSSYPSHWHLCLCTASQKEL